MKRIVAFLLLFTGLAAVADWIIFSLRHEKKFTDFEVFKKEYLNHLPGFLQPVFQNPLVSTLLLMSIFLLVGVIFIKEGKRRFTIIGIFAFVMAFWQLFSLM